MTEGLDASWLVRAAAQGGGGEQGAGGELLSRRRLMQGLGAGAGALLGAALADPGRGLADEGMAPELRRRLMACRPAGEGLEALLAGNRRFCAQGRPAAEAVPPCRVDPLALSKGQQPWAAVLTCADSRFSPERLFDVGPGELFDVRTAGNTASGVAVASLEYAVAALGVELIVVLGHAGCGAVQAALAAPSAAALTTPALEQLLADIRPSLRPGDALSQAVRRHAVAVAAQLPRRSALLTREQAAGRLRVAALHVEVATGVVTRL